MRHLHLTRLCVVLLVLIQSVVTFAQGSPVTDPNLVLTPATIPLQPVGTTFTDPTFDTNIRRITGVTSGGGFGTHIYSQLQAFSADNQYLLLVENDNYVIREVASLALVNGLNTANWNAPRWHPTQPHVIIHYDSNGDTTLRLQFTNVDTQNTTTQLTFPSNYQRIRSNQSFDEIAEDGSWLGGMASLANGDQMIFAVNLNTMTLGAQISLNTLYSNPCDPDPQWGNVEPDWIGVSPLGRYLMVQWAADGTQRCNGLESFNLSTGAFVGRVYDGHQHGDLGVYPNGTTEFFMTYELYHPSGNLSIGLRDLPGNSTVATPTYIQVLDDWFGEHISCRGPYGVCLITTFGDNSNGWSALEGELFLQYTDGSVWRLAHHRSTSCGYWVQPRASLSRDGRYVVFASDWGTNSCGGGNDLGAGEVYVIDLSTNCIATTPTLLTPVHRAHTTDRTPFFTWTSVNGAQSYRFKIYTEDRSFTFKKRVFQPNYNRAKYLWRVQAQDINCGTWIPWTTRFTLFVD
jgi:hypothetical protein